MNPQNLQKVESVGQAIDKLAELYDTACATARTAIEERDYDAYADVVRRLAPR